MELYRSPGLTTAPEVAQPDHVRGTPPLARKSMTPRRWGRIDPLSWLLRHDNGPARMAGPTAGAGLHRRLILLFLSLAPALYATWIMSGLLPSETASWPELVLLALFAVLSCWVAAGFWTAIMGFSVLWRGRDRYLISRSIAGTVPISDAARTAIVMPICNEDVRRVFAGLRATYESLARTGEIARFDFFVLSDSNDPDICVAELDAWNALQDETDASERIFYRRRLRRVKRKSGNIDDFCRRWGGRYRYMVVLDADSVMSGDCLTTLVRLMEARPDAGIIQTAPQAAGRDTLHARVQQFASHVYGPLFTAGLHYWQLGESHYWGHNAIIRLEPFIRHCALAPLPGRGALAGEILSHDFVEAALMRRAGYGVWIAYDLHGSYEETPPNLLDEVKRDRRWCHGNLMNARLMFARGIHPVHRTVFLTGTLAYASAALWFGFLALSSWIFISHASVDPQYFVVPHQLFPLWPSWQPEHALALVGAVAVLLFLPKILAAVVMGARNSAQFGGGFRLAASVLAEMVLSALLAPIRMVFHTRFVLAALLGWSIQWKSPSRADESTPWGEAVRRHGGQALLGLAWVAAVAWHAPDFVPWLAPVAAGLILSIPLSVWTSRASLGSLARRWGLFLTPAETRPPHEIAATAHYAGAPRPLARFADAVIDPDIHATVFAQARVRRSPAVEAQRNMRVTRALTDGPGALSRAERMAILDDAIALDRLHRAVRSAPAHPAWYATSTSAGRATITHFGTREARLGTVRVPAIRAG